MAALDLSKIKRRAGGVFNGFTRGQKTMLAIAVVGLVIGGYLFMSWAGKASFAPLYSNLTAEDASAVTSDLTSRGIQYKLADDGTTVLVPQSKVYQTRIDLSAKGLPSVGAKGYDLLDKQGITTSDFRQHVDYQRALEGELSKTITAIHGITDASVHLVIPQQDVFADDNTHPSASVLVTTDAGTTVPSGEVNAIVHLVASSVEGLTPDQVTVADSKGHILAAPGEGVTSAAGDARSEQTSAFENQLGTEITSLLTPVTGDGKAVVRVNASLNFDEKSSTAERFPTDPSTSAPVVSESTSDETYTGAGDPTATGILGTATTVAATTPTTALNNAGGTTGNGTSYDKKGADRTYAVSKITEQLKTAPGAVEKLSVAVLLDSTAKVDPNQIQQLVTAAAGLDTKRGDVIQVSQMAFDNSAATQASATEKAAAAAKSQKQMLDLARTVGVVLLVIVILFFAYRSAKKSTAMKKIPLQLGPAQSGSALELDATTALAALEAAGAFERPALPPLGSKVDDERQLAIDQIGDLIDRQPDEVAKMLRNWLADRRG
jgi:flagellar M-ring protein FliF